MRGVPPRRSAQSADGALIAAEVNVLAREWSLPSEVGHASLIVECPEIDGLTAHEDEVTIEVGNLRQDWANIGVGQIRHSSGFDPRRLTRTLGKAK
jgi:hypothetical protein